VALSPSLWINESNIYFFEEKYSHHPNQEKQTIYLGVGSRETLNKILKSSRRMRDTLEKRNYPGVNLN